MISKKCYTATAMFGLVLFWYLQAIAASSPEQRAVDYLARETPSWKRENGCMSCHNNGDAARALYAASQAGLRVPSGALDDTTEWLLHPERWGLNPGTPQFSDRRLARIQFGAALVAVPASRGRETALRTAAELLAGDQDADGSWRVDEASLAGSPCTYGPALATYSALRTLQAAGDARFQPAIEKAEAWLLRLKARSLMDSSVILLFRPGRSGELERLLANQTSDGGWGPQPNAPAEVFDTALALLALKRANQPSKTGKPVERGRAFLLRTQQAAGGWPETTRPSGNLSYAQHISTSGWATMALIETRSLDPKSN